MKFPMQPLAKDGQGVVRFRQNAIVSYLLDNGGIDLNRIGLLGFSDEDATQFAQLIGYSLSGFHELSYVSDEDAHAASAEAKRLGLVKGPGGCRDEGCEIHGGLKPEDPS